MSRPVLETAKPEGVWRRNDPRLVRAAQRLIRLYDGQQAGPFWIKAESIAAVIAEELNQAAEESAACAENGS
jgi:hypothetical protein